MATLAWLSTELTTGLVIADLPDLGGESGGALTLKQTMGRYEQVNVSLPLPTAPENWRRATLHGAACMVLLQDDIPVWGGFVNRRPRDEGDVVTMPLMTAEGYLDRRYVGDMTFVNVDQNLIVKAVVEAYVATGSNGGIPIRVQIVGGPGKLRTRTYMDKDDKTVYSALQELSGVIDGPEWMIGLEHLTGPERYTFVLYVGNRLGNAVAPGLGPSATFEMPGGVKSFLALEDFGAGSGANDVMAYSSGQGDDRPQSPRQVFADPNRPTFEYRYSPSSSIQEIDTLTDHAAGRLQLMANGANILSLTAILDDSPKLGVDWGIGDDIGYQLGGIDSSGKDTVPAFPGGLGGVTRALGYELELSATPTITPIIEKPEDG